MFHQSHLLKSRLNSCFSCDVTSLAFRLSTSVPVTVSHYHRSSFSPGNASGWIVSPFYEWNFLHRKVKCLAQGHRGNSGTSIWTHVCSKARYLPSRSSCSYYNKPHSCQQSLPVAFLSLTAYKPLSTEAFYTFGTGWRPFQTLPDSRLLNTDILLDLEPKLDEIGFMQLPFLLSILKASQGSASIKFKVWLPWIFTL